MTNQKDVARVLGISQTTVSRALHGDRSISTEMRQKVQDAAKRIGYHPNAYLTVLMSNIRTGKKLTDKGVIGLLIDDRSQHSWHEVETYRIFHQGVIQRAIELGFHVDLFFLRQPGMTNAKIDRILSARGIKGIILAPPYRGNRAFNLHWENYAAVGVGFGWEKQELNRVAYDTFQNFTTAFNELRQTGYKRIGTVLNKMFVDGNRHGIKWYAAYLDCQNNIPKDERIPVLASDYPPIGAPFSEGVDQKLAQRFRAWVFKWQPDVILTMVGKEKRWLDSMSLQIPRDIGLACLAKTPDVACAGIDEMGEIVGATSLELVAAQIARNEFGPPAHPRTTIIEGRWINGSTLQNGN